MRTPSEVGCLRGGNVSTGYFLQKAEVVCALAVFEKKARKFIPDGWCGIIVFPHIVTVLCTCRQWENQVMLLVRQTAAAT